MEIFLIGLVLAVLGAGFVGLVLAIVALARVSALRRQLSGLQELERTVDALRRRVEQLSAAPRAPPAAAPEPKQPAPAPPPRPAVPQAKPAPLPPPPPETPRVRPAASEPPPPPLPTPRIEWERWIGIRGAAVLGAVALALAGVLFFKYSIDRGLITPTMRIVFGTITGLGCILGSPVLRKGGYAWAADGISGAGIVILYAAFWAARVLYGLIGTVPAFVLMVLVTTTCCLLAYHSRSLLIAVLGLAGGFATPLLLASGTDRPIGLFGYVLLLDLGLLALGHRRRWPSLGVLSLVGTVLLQGLWIGVRMGPERAFLGLAILAVFAVLFVVAGRFAAPAGAAPPAHWMVQAGAILFPFAFALYFASRIDLGPHLFPLALLLALLGAAACWTARAQQVQPLALAAAVATVGVVGVWLVQHTLTTALAWEVAAVASGLAVVYHVWVERDPQPADLEGPAPAAISAAGGLLALTVLASAAASPVAPWPWLAVWTALGALLYRHGEMPRRGLLRLVAVIGLGTGVSLQHVLHGGQPVFPASTLYLALMVAFCIALQAAALWRKPTADAGSGDQGAALLPLIFLVSLAVSEFAHGLAPVAALGTALLLGVLSLLAATRSASGVWCGAATAATLLAQAGWMFAPRAAAPSRSDMLAALALMALSVIVFTAWPFLAAKRFLAQRAAWYAAALAGPIWFLPLKQAFVACFGDAFIGVLPVGLGVLAVAALERASSDWPGGAARRTSALAWFGAVALGVLTLAIPLQLEKEWITIGWALEGLGAIVLWRRLDHPGLKYFALVLFGAASARLVLNPALPGYYPRSSVRLFNWLTYTYLVPAAALFASAALLRPFEVGRLGERERRFYGKELALGASCIGLAGVLVTFVWINLTIADWFATGSRVTLSFGDRPAQRLVVSLAWAVYALVLLGVGVRGERSGLRWISLGFLLITIGKVFLYDLGNLGDLYRVASLAGLAVSLISVSLLYQRFVFRKETPSS